MNTNNQKRDDDRFDSLEAAEQTSSAWIQVGLSLISFGFAFGSIIAFMRSEHFDLFFIKVIRVIGLFLIFLGIASIILALFHHHKKKKTIKKGDFFNRSDFDMPLLIGGLVVILGSLAFLSVLIHMVF